MQVRAAEAREAIRGQCRNCSFAQDHAVVERSLAFASKHVAIDCEAIADIRGMALNGRVAHDHAMLARACGSHTDASESFAMAAEETE